MTLDSKTDLEMIHVEKPHFTDFSVQILENDPWLIRRGCQVIGNIPRAGTFFLVEDPKDHYIYTLHESLIASMYSVKDFIIKRNFYLNSFSNSGDGTTQPSVAQLESGSTAPPKEAQKSKNRLWADIDDQSYAHEASGLQDESVEEEVESQGEFDYNKFIKVTLDGLTSRRGTWVPYCDLKGKELDVLKEPIYLLDYVCSFIDARNVVDPSHGTFTYTFFYKKFNEINEWSGDPDSRPSSIFGDQSGLTPTARFHLQSMQGKDQFSFLRVLILFCIRSVASFETIAKDDKIKKDFKIFLMDENQSFDDCLSIVRVNKNALKNNQKILVNTRHLKLVVKVE